MDIKANIEKSKKYFQVLSLDGSGVRGIFHAQHAQLLSSMEKGKPTKPKLPNQSMVLVDRNQQRRHNGRVYVIPNERLTAEAFRKKQPLRKRHGTIKNSNPKRERRNDRPKATDTAPPPPKPRKPKK